MAPLYCQDVIRSPVVKSAAILSLVYMMFWSLHSDESLAFVVPRLKFTLQIAATHVAGVGGL